LITRLVTFTAREVHALLITIFPQSKHLSIMGYEDSVYLAKLAEQAERYEG